MKAVDFPYSNKKLTRPEDMCKEECGELPVYADPEGPIIISCWVLSWRERLSALLFGRVWMWVRAKDTHPPTALLAHRNIFSEKYLRSFE